ncbi:MAG TPA: hypothetical protein VIN10_05375 [Bacteroidales bacterium]
MKRVHKILLIVGIIVVVGAIAGVVFRHQIASYALRTVIKNRSDGNVTLEIKDTYFSPFRGTVSLTGPDIHFANAFLDEAQSVKLNRISLDEILIDSISIIDVLFNRHILAGQLIIKKPVIWFEEREGEEKSSFDPDKLMQTLNREPPEMSRLNISIRDIEIQYGTLNMSGEANDKFAPGYVDFRLILHNFSTQPPPDTTKKRILFSDDFLFKLKNLKKSFASGYELTIDSALFSSIYNKMDWNGVSLYAIQDDTAHKQGISLYAGSFTLNDIEVRQISSISDLHLSSVIISDGYLYNYGERFIKQHSNDTLNKKGISELFSILHGFELDTLWLNQFNYARVLDNHDTVFLADDISMMVIGIEIDSAMMTDPLKLVVADEIFFRTGRFYAKELIDSIDAEFTDIAYYSDEQKFELNGLSIIDNDRVRGKNALTISSGRIKIDDFSLFKFQKEEKQAIRLTIIEPQIVYNTELKVKPKKGKKKNNLTELFSLERFVIKNGDFAYSNDSLSFKVNNLDFFADNLEFTDKGRVPLKYKNLFVNLENLAVDSESLDDRISTGRIFYEGNYLRIEDIKTSFRTGKEKYKSSMLLGSLEFKEVKLEKFLRWNVLEVGEVLINSPVINGKVQVDSRKDTVSEMNMNKAILPFKLEIGRLNISNGNADCKVFIKKDSVYIKSNIDLELKDLAGDNTDTLNLWLENIAWNLKLSASNLANGRMKVAFKELMLDEMNSRFVLKGFTFKHDEKLREKEQAFEINELSVPKIDINGLDYNRFIFDDTLYFKKILIDKPTLKAVIHPVPKKDENNKPNPNFTFLSKIYYDTIELKNLRFNLENKGKNSSHAFYKLQDLNIFHSMEIKSDTNLFSGLAFNFNDFSYKDTITNKYVVIASGDIDSKNRAISISELKSGELDKDNNYSNSLNDNLFRLTDIQLSGIYLENKMPTQLTIRKLKVDSLNLYFIAKDSSGTAPSEIEVNRNLLEKYNHIISKFKIDSTLLNNLTINYLRNVNEEESTVSFNNVALVLNKISLDTVKSDSHTFPLNDVTINLRGRTFITKDSLYSFKTGNINYNFPLNKVTVDSLTFKPRYEGQDFFNKAVYQTDRMDIFVDKVEINDFRFKEYLEDKIIHAGSVDLHRIHADMSRDKAYPMKPGLFKDMPQAEIRNASQIFTVDSLRVFDSYIAYTQRVIKSETPGEIFFDRFNIQLYNLSNDPRYVDSTTQMVLNANAYIMGQSRLDLSAYFRLLSPTDEFWFKASSEPIDLVCLNSMTENLMGMAISQGKGYIDNLKIEGDSGTAQGKMLFRYKKLKITLYNRKKAQLHKGMFTPLVDFMLNDLLLKSNNPKWARSPRIGQAYFERDTQKGIVNYIFKSSLSGILSTLGFNNKEQRQEKKDTKDEEMPE